MKAVNSIPVPMKLNSFCAFFPCQMDWKGRGTEYDKDGNVTGITKAYGKKYVCERRYYGKCHGPGTYTSFNGTKYVGGWKARKKHGQGNMTMADGSKCVGQWKDDRPHGYGTLTWPDGQRYVGEWKNGDPWEGTQYDKDGNVIVTYSEGVGKSAN